MQVMQLFTIGLYELELDGSPQLDAAGAPVAEALDPKKNAEKNADATTFVLGDAAGITALERELLMRRDGLLTVTLGPRVLMASHCIVLAHAALDNARRERVDG